MTNRRIFVIEPSRGNGLIEPKVKVTLEGGDTFELPVEIFLRHGLHEGDILAPERLAELQGEAQTVLCRQTALRLLSRRPRGRAELARALKQRRFPKEVVEQIVAALVQSGAIDDRAVAGLLAEERGRQKEGPRLVQSRLLSRGFDRETTREAVQPLESTESQLAGALALLAKWNRRSKPAEPQARRRAALGFLLRRGYDGEICRRVVEKVLGRGAEGAQDE